MSSKRYTVWMDDKLMEKVSLAAKNKSSFIRKAIMQLLEDMSAGYKEDKPFWSKKQKADISFLLYLLKDLSHGSSLKKIDISKSDGLIKFGTWKNIVDACLLLEYFFRKESIEMCAEFEKDIEMVTLNFPEGLENKTLSLLYDAMK